MNRQKIKTEKRNYDLKETDCQPVRLKRICRVGYCAVKATFVRVVKSNYEVENVDWQL